MPCELVRDYETDTIFFSEAVKEFITKNGLF
jgi:hypothetical protein